MPMLAYAYARLCLCSAMLALSTHARLVYSCSPCLLMLALSTHARLVYSCSPCLLMLAYRYNAYRYNAYRCL
jgi:hypothetical protein